MISQKEFTKLEVKIRCFLEDKIVKDNLKKTNVYLATRPISTRLMKRCDLRKHLVFLIIISINLICC